jgi:hypothetical protein
MANYREYDEVGIKYHENRGNPWLGERLLAYQERILILGLT